MSAYVPQFSPTHPSPQVPPGGLVNRIVVNSPGGHDKLSYETHKKTNLTSRQVRVEAKAIGVNFADTAVRMGLYASAKDYVKGPITPGFEVSGVITEVGDKVTKFTPGDEVFAVTLFNGYTSSLVVDDLYVFDKPKNVSHEQMASIPVVFMTAWYALFELAHPRPGATVLVHSAAGGVGTALVQLLNIAGCEVTGVVGSSKKVEAVKQNGAKHVIDKSKQDLWAEASRIAPDGFDLILDANGPETMKKSYEHLRRAGKLVTYGFASMMPKSGGKPNYLALAWNYLKTPRFNPFDMTTNSKSVLSFNLSYLFDRLDVLSDAMRDISNWLDEGKITAPAVTTYPLADAARAHADIESGKTIGKLILVP